MICQNEIKHKKGKSILLSHIISVTHHAILKKLDLVSVWSVGLGSIQSQIWNFAIILQHFQVNQPLINLCLNRWGQYVLCEFRMTCHATGVLCNIGSLPPCGVTGVVTKDKWTEYLIPPSVNNRIKDGDNKYQLTIMTQTKEIILLNKWRIPGIGGQIIPTHNF